MIVSLLDFRCCGPPIPKADPVLCASKFAAAAMAVVRYSSMGQWIGPQLPPGQLPQSRVDSLSMDHSGDSERRVWPNRLIPSRSLPNWLAGVFGLRCLRAKPGPKALGFSGHQEIWAG